MDLYRIRIKILWSGVIIDGFQHPIHTEDGDVIELPFIFSTTEQVAYIAEPVILKDVEEWFASNEQIPLIDFLTRKHSDMMPPTELVVTSDHTLETDNTPAEDQDHEQDHQDHEPEPEPDVGQNEPETPQDGLTTLQRQIFTELKEHGAGTVAELIDRLKMPGMQAAIRKNLHVLMDEKHLISKRSSIQNGRPAQLWEVVE